MQDTPLPSTILAMLTEPERIQLARLDTPLESYAGVLPDRELLVKRDDLTGSGLSGNKIRKLEYLIAEALSHGCKRLVTCGGIQSNHCRATVLAAAKVGLEAKVYLRTNAPPRDATAYRGNLALMHMAGASIEFVDADWYAERDQNMSLNAVPHDYVIPEGGSNALGAWGYISAIAELHTQLQSKPSAIIVATGSGGTVAGIELGLRLYDLHDIPVYGVCACDDEPYFQQACSRITYEAHQIWPELDAIPPGQFKFIEGYVGLGYALSTPEEREELHCIMRRCGLVLDPVYTNKAFRALVHEPDRFGHQPLFIHTGGIFGLLA
ncbi:MAG: pyridoxal-phosphate dependent enzyme [Myxococcota bacterium]|nr:pyridoxal-phosphate dependent enzyme [Myxococcota bacterium]